MTLRGIPAWGPGVADLVIGACLREEAREGRGGLLQILKTEWFSRALPQADLFVGNQLRGHCDCINSDRVSRENCASEGAMPVQISVGRRFSFPWCWQAFIVLCVYHGFGKVAFDRQFHFCASLILCVCVIPVGGGDNCCEVFVNWFGCW